MTNLQAAVRDYRWNNRLSERAFAEQLGVTTKQYNRFEEGKLDTDTLLAVMRWLFVDPDPPAIAKPSEDQAERVRLRGVSDV